MKASCPTCETNYVIDHLIPGVACGVIKCAVCHAVFHVHKTKRFLRSPSIKTELRADPETTQEKPNMLDTNG